MYDTLEKKIESAVLESKSVIAWAYRGKDSLRRVKRESLEGMDICIS